MWQRRPRGWMLSRRHRRWIDVTKKGKGKETTTIPTPTIIHMTLEDEQRRKTRALHVRVTGLKDRDESRPI